MRFLLLGIALLLAGCATQEPIQAPIVADTEPTNENFDAMPMGTLAVSEITVKYFDDVEGFLAEPETGACPGVILIHEWWGLNDNIKETARRIASHGYRVLAVDLYEGKVATNSSQAQALRSGTNATRSTQNLRAANDYLRASGSERVASWGYCFGGGESMRFGLEGTVDATVVYYGNLQPAILMPEKVEAPVLLIYGDQDTSTTADSARELQLKLEPYGVETQLYVYEGVGHAFANPSNAGHDPIKTRDAWEKTLVFVQRELR